MKVEFREEGIWLGGRQVASVEWLDSASYSERFELIGLGEIETECDFLNCPLCGDCE